LNKDFSEENYPFIKCIYFCGEMLQKSLVKEIFKRFPEIKIINAYGPTEAASAVSAIEITEEILEKEELLPVGKISSAATEITVENGEIVLKGKSVSKGYLSGETGGFYKENGKNCFKTGDVGFIENGKLYCKGRSDSQIKYKGYRIELSEIEANISSVPRTENCAVIAKRNPDGEVRLIKAFVSGNVSEEEIRKKLSENLPEYMIPKSIKKLDFIPFNKNGKIDRKELEKL
jgi:D-alanine--poly(phosphoribitol) ligase subunit 1